MGTDELLEQGLSGGSEGGRRLLERELRRRGISWSLDELERVFVRTLLSRPLVVDEGSGFTAEEERLLGDGGMGADRRLAEGVESPAMRSAAEYATLVGTSLSTGEAAEAIGISEGRVRQRLAGRTLYGIKGHHGDPHRSPWLVPAFQFGEQGLIPGIREVAPELSRNLSPVTVERWFNAPNDELIPEDWGGAGEEPVSPRDWLLSGLPPRRVALLARYLGETP